MDVYVYRQVVLDAGVVDVTGFDVEASDGRIGKVDEATYENSAGCLVVDTGWWILGKKRMLPAGVVRRIDPEEKVVFVEMTKDEIKAAPDLDDARHAEDEDSYHREVGGYYEPYANRS